MFSQQVILKISYSNSFLKTVLFKTNHEKYLYILTESNERIHQPNQPYSNTADKQDSDDFFFDTVHILAGQYLRYFYFFLNYFCVCFLCV